MVKCKYCSDMAISTSLETCVPCKEFKRCAKRALENDISAFYKILHEILEPYQMVCVSKTILP